MLKRSRRGQVDPFIVMDVMRAAAAQEKAGREVLHLEVGQPGTPAPLPVREAAARALSSDRVGYTVAQGVPELRARIQEHYGRTYGVEVPVERIFLTTGSSGGFILSFLAAFEAGDRVALALPGYPAYRNILSGLGLEVAPIPANLASGYQPTAAHLKALNPKVDGLIVASPANPTGSMVGPTDMADLVRYCRETGVRLVSDEIYHGVTYGEPATTALSFGDEVIVINSFSKYFSMTGWRLGWMVAPEDLIRSVECLAQNFFISPPTLSQLAALAAFDSHDELQENVRRYAENRATLLAWLPKAGFVDLAPADGAFYLYGTLGDEIVIDSPDYCRRALEEIGVAITPGLDFDPERGHRTARVSFAGSTEDVIRAARRLAAWRPE